MSIERILRTNGNYNSNTELKAAKISNTEKKKLFKSLRNYYKFGAVVDQNRVHSRIFDEKKSKQRYLDYVYKVCLKRALKSLINNSLIDVSFVENIYIYTDEHTTATNGKYELKEALEQEFKYGTFNSNYEYFFEPLFPNMKSVQLKLCDSSANTLIRALILLQITFTI